MIDRIFHEIDVFAGQAPQFDDITMLVVRRLADPAVSGPVRESASRES